VARAGVAVLEATGRQVVVPTGPLCCGRPLYDYGMLATAKRQLRGVLAGLRPFIRRGVHVVGLEPSCTAVFRDELVNLFPHDEDAKRLSLQTLTLAEWLAQEAPDWEPPRLRDRVLVHGHCHHKAVMGIESELDLLKGMGAETIEPDAGCCGLAGSFGFEAEHYDISMQIGERKLLPLVRETPAETLLVADGFSCCMQIEHGTGRRPLHLAQAMAGAVP
jgi:Fe-S oxidoreductase